MSYGAPDRGGGREGKKGSLRKSKVNAAEAAKKAQAKPRDERPETSPAAPPVSLPPLPSSRTGPLADAFVNLVSRQFDRDREAVLRRARDASVVFCVVASADVDKQSDVAALCREFPGTLYCVAGALPDNIKRTCNDKQLAAWLAAVTDIALSPECVAIQAGLDLGREAATHHAQERLFDMHVALAKRVGLPLMVHAAPGSLERCADLLAAVDPPPFALLNAAVHCAADADAAEGEASPLDAWREAGGWLVVTGALLSEPDAPGAAAAAARLGAFAKQPDALLLATGAPQHTPQTLSDSYLRTMRNEPSNAPQILADLAAAAGNAPAAPLAQALWRNALEFFGLAPAADAAAAASTPAPPPPVQAKAKPAKGEPASSPAKAAAVAAAADDSSGSEEEEEAAAPPARRPNASAFAQLALDEKDADIASGSSSSDADDDDADESLAARRRAATLGGSEPGAGEEEAQWACRRCRARLFAPRAVVWHGVGGDRAAFAARKAADDNSCIASVFVACADAGGLGALGLAAADGGDGGGSLKLACGRCGTKLGRFADAPQPCSCGALVPGPAAKLTAARLDFVDARAAGDALRLRGELDAAAGVDHDAEAAAQAAEAKRRREAHQKPKLAKQTGGNFSNYRNKTT